MQINPLFLTVLATMQMVGYDEKPEPAEGSEPIEIYSLEPDETLFERVPAFER